MKRFVLAILLILATLSIAGATPSYFSDIIVTGTGGVWTDSRAYINLTAAIAALGSDERDLYIAENESVTTLTIPSTLKLHFLKNGAITTTGTLTVNTKSVEAGDRQIFYGVGAVDFANGSKVRSTWFSDIDEAVAETGNDRVTLVIARDDWVTVNASVGSRVTLKFEAPGNRVTIAAGIVLNGVRDVIAGDFVCFRGAGRVNFSDGAKVKSSWFNRFEYGIRHVDDSFVDLEVSESDIVYANTTVHANTTLRPRRGAVLSDGGRTASLVVSGDVVAGPDQQIFNWTGTGEAIVSHGTKSYASWWGNPVATFWIDMNAADQGAASVTSDRTVKDIVDAVGSRDVEIVVSHTGPGDTTAYPFSTSETTPENVVFIFQQGAVLIPDVGVTVTIYSPASIVATDGQQIVATTNNFTNPLVFTQGGEVHPHWFGAVVDGATNDYNAWQTAFNSFGTWGGRLQAPVGNSNVGSTIVWPNNGTTCYPIDLVGHDVGNQGASPGNVSQITYTAASGNLLDMRNGTGATLVWPGSIRNIFLQGQWTSGGGNTSKGVVAWKIRYSTIEHISINKFSTCLRVGDDAASNGSAIYSSINHVTLANADTLFDATKCLFNDSIINGLRLSGADGIGLSHTGGGGHVTITNSWVEGCGSYGMQFGNDVSVGISGSYFEGNTTAHVYAVNTNNDAGHGIVTLVNNNFSPDTNCYSLKIDNVGNVNLIGNHLAAADGFAIQVVGRSPSGCVIGNTGPRDGSPMFPADYMARMITSNSVTPNVGHATTFPDTIHNHIEGSFYFSDNILKDVLGWYVTESGVGSAYPAIPATTCTTDGVTATITNLSQDDGLCRGMSINIAGETFGTLATDYATILYLNPVADTAVLDKVTNNGVGPGAALTKNGVVRAEIRGIPVSRNLHTTATTVGLGEDDLRSVTLPANYFLTPDGSWTGGIKIFAVGEKTGVADDKTIKLHVGGGAVVVHPAVNNATDWRLEAVVSARGVSNSQGTAWICYSGPGALEIVTNAYSPTAQDATAPITIKITGECANAGDTITQTMWHVESF